MKKVLLSIAAFALVFSFVLMPRLTLAQNDGDGSNTIDVSGLQSTADQLRGLVNTLVPVFIAVAFIAFIVGIIRYLWAGGAEAKEKAKHQLIWGIVSITAIVAVFGIAQLFVNVFGLTPVQLPSGFIPGVEDSDTP